MPFDVSTLVSYIIENQDLLITKSLFGAKTASLIKSEGNVMVGIKFAEQINILGTDAIFQDGSGCTRFSSGTTTITQRKVTVGPIAVVEDICVKDLNRTYMSKALTAGSTANDLPFEKEYTGLKAATIAKQCEIALWQGDTTSLNANLNRYDGLIKNIDTSTLAVNGNPAGITVSTGITVGNIKGVIDGVWQALPADVMGNDDIRIFCGWDIFTKFLSAYRDQNLFNFTADGSEVKKENGEVVIPGTTYRLTAVHGLDTTSRIFGLRMSNLYLGTDLENEEEQFEMMPDQFKNFLRFQSQFKQGVNVALPFEVVSFKLV